MDTSIKYSWYFYQIGLFRYDPSVWFIYGIINKVEIDINECEYRKCISYNLNLTLLFFIKLDRIRVIMFF